MDADCTVDLPSEPPPGEWDICLIDNVHPHHINRISSAFILFRDTPNTRMFLSTWEQNNKQMKKDHPALTKTINQLRTTVHFIDGTAWLKDRHVINALLPNRGRYE